MSSDIVECLNNFLKINPHPLFKDVIKVTLSNQDVTGDGQALIVSEVNRIILTLEKSNGDKKMLKAILKKPTESAGKSFAEQSDIFKSEAWMYSEVLRSMERLMLQVGDKGLIWPECYYNDDNKLLLEDLCESGSKIVPMQELLDVNHTVLVMKAIGKFHGLSMILKERGELDVSKIKPIYYLHRTPFVTNLHRLTVVSVAKIIKEEWSSEWTSAADGLEKLVDNPAETLCNMVNSSKNKWQVLNHGDFTMRNMLFHYQPGSTKPGSNKFVDFQMCHYDHMGYDLVSLLYSSLIPQVRDENMDTFLYNYRESLAHTCRTHGYKGSIPSVDDIKGCIDSISYLEAVIPFIYLPYAIMCRKGGKGIIQKKVDESMQSLMNPNLPRDLPLSDDLRNTYRDPDTINFLKYEITRLVNKNII